jgi:hypothetical protein
LRSSTHSGETSSGNRSSGTFSPVYAGVSKADRFDVPARSRLADRCEVRGGIIRVPNCDDTSIDVSGQGINRVEDRLRDPAGLVDDHQHERARIP